MMKLNWVTLRVSNLEQSVAFYTEALGMEVAARLGGGGHQIAMLGKADEAKVELICETGSKIESPGNGVSIGLESEDLDALVNSLKAKSYPVTGPVSPNPHVRFFFVKDPDGYAIQLVGRV